MNIGISGASGLIGRSFCRLMRNGGHQLRIFGRTAVEGLPVSSWDLFQGPPDLRALEGLDAFVHLAGTPIAEGRWTAQRKRLIRESRITGTRNLVEGLLKLSNPPKVLVSASAVGFYGDRGDEVLAEESSPGNGFLPEVCVAWEAEAFRAGNAGIRVVTLRTGIVLATDGGALAKMLPPFRIGAGGRLGSGSQFMPWIHLDDETSLLGWAVENPNIVGPMNAVAPNPVTNREFVRELSRALKRPAWIPVPSAALRIALGEMADLLLEGQRVVPRKAVEAGFSFRFPRLREAISALLG